MVELAEFLRSHIMRMSELSPSENLASLCQRKFLPTEEYIDPSMKKRLNTNPTLSHTLLRHRGAKGISGMRVKFNEDEIAKRTGLFTLVYRP